MTSQPNDAASVAELRQQVVDARLCAEQARIEADQLKLDNNRSVSLSPYHSEKVLKIRSWRRYGRMFAAYFSDPPCI